MTQTKALNLVKKSKYKWVTMISQVVILISLFILVRLWMGAAGRDWFFTGGINLSFGSIQVKYSLRDVSIQWTAPRKKTNNRHRELKNELFDVTYYPAIPHCQISKKL